MALFFMTILKISYGCCCAYGIRPLKYIHVNQCDEVKESKDYSPNINGKI